MWRHSPHWPLEESGVQRPRTRLRDERVPSVSATTRASLPLCAGDETLAIDRNPCLRIMFFARHLDRGGVTFHMLDLGSRLLERGHEVAIVSCGPRRPQGGISPEEVIERGLTHYTVPFPRPGDGFRKLAHGVRAAFAVRRVAAAFRPDLIHVHWRSTSPFAQLLRIADGIPFVSTLHNSEIPHGALLKAASFWGTSAIAISAETEQRLAKDFDVPRSRIRLVSSGADERRFRPPAVGDRSASRARVGVADDAFVIGMVARLAKDKGQDVLLRALGRLLSEHPTATVLLAGDDYGFRTELKRMAKEFEIEQRVRWLGHVDSRDVYWASDVVTLPSRVEGFGLVVIEAMLCGVPVVRTPAAGAHEQFVNGVSGLLVPFDDPEALAAVLHRLAVDSEFRTGLGKRALCFARERFTLDIMVEKTLRVYAETLRLPANSAD